MTRLRDIDLEHIAEQIQRGYTSGIANGFSWDININIDEDYFNDDTIEKYQEWFEECRNEGKYTINDQYILIYKKGEFWLKDVANKTMEAIDEDCDQLHDALS